MKQAISHEEISSICMELSLLLHAGVGTADALALLAEESEPQRRELLSRMAQQADEGESLSAIMRNEDCFPTYVCGLTETGERAGRLEEALRALAHYYEEQARTSRHIRSALLYPAIMLVLMLIVIAVILIQVLPVFNQVYESLGGRLTGVAEALLNVGTLLGRGMPILWALLALAAVFLSAFAAFPSFRESLLGVWRRCMGDSGLAQRMNRARIAQTLAMAMASGLPLEESLDLAAGILEDIPAAERKILACRKCLEQGTPPGEAMRESELFPAAQCRLLELGQRSGSQDAVMEKIAVDLAEESSEALDRMVSRVEPALVLICSALVGMILLSVMLPLTHIMTAIG